MTIYVDDEEKVKIYSVKTKVAKAIMTLLETDDDLVYSETHKGYSIKIVDKEEKESFINKPCCISSEVCEHDKQKVLDKIRAEIVEMRSKQNCSCADCLDIIDKYRTESEIKK